MCPCLCPYCTYACVCARACARTSPVPLNAFVHHGYYCICFLPGQTFVMASISVGGLHSLLGRNCACKFAIMFGRVPLAWITDITGGLSEFWGITLPFTAHDVWCGSVVFSCVVFDLILAFINPSSPTLRKYTHNTPYLSCPSMTFYPTGWGMCGGRDYSCAGGRESRWGVAHWHSRLQLQLSTGDRCCDAVRGRRVVTSADDGCAHTLVCLCS